MDTIIEIDTTVPCVSPRMMPDERVAEALTQLAFELVVLEGALSKGAILTEAQKSKLVSIGNRMVRRAG